MYNFCIAQHAWDGLVGAIPPYYLHDNDQFHQNPTSQRESVRMAFGLLLPINPYYFSFYTTIIHNINHGTTAILPSLKNLVYNYILTAWPNVCLTL
jgi:hypothetical protein